MKIIVTGGAGFIGSSVIRDILNTTEHTVINIDSLTYAGDLSRLDECADSKKYFFENVDICNIEGLKKIFDIYRPSLVMHLAAESHVDRSIEDPGLFMTTNIIGTYNLLEVSRVYFEKHCKAKNSFFRFHHISTDEVYGDLTNSNDFFTETTAYSPSSPYSASKASSDHLVRSWGRTYGLPILITNCSNNYGPYHFPEKLIPHIILNAMAGKSLPIYGNGLQIRDWLFVNDHAKALIKVAINGRVGETYNIGGHNEKTNIEVVESICSILETLAPIKPMNIQNYRDLITYVEDRPGHDVRYAIDASKIQNELDWIPEETFETGLYKTVKWYIDNPAWCKRILAGDYQLNRLGKGHE